MKRTRSLRLGCWCAVIALGGWVGVAGAGVISEGDADTRADLARSTFGVDGSGVTVGIISDSFFQTGASPAGELPAGVTVLRDGLPTDHDQGRAMAEVIHDLAPGANILFHAAFNSPDPADHTPGIGGVNRQPRPGALITAANQLVAHGASMIVIDSAMYNEPWFQDGPVAQALTAISQAGTPVIASAGHFGNQTWEGPLVDSGILPVGTGGTIGHHASFAADNNHDINNAFLHMTVEPGESIQVAMQWSEAFPANGGTTSYDLNLVLEENDGLFFPDLAVSERIQNSAGGGGAGDADLDGELDKEPWELLSYTNDSGVAKSVQLAVIIHKQPAFTPLRTPMVKIIVAGDDVDLDRDPNATGGSTLVGHAAAEGVLAVATLDHLRYSFGDGPPLPVDASSSPGPTEIMFNPNGQPVLVGERPGPDLTGPDGVSISDSFPAFAFEPGSMFEGQRSFTGGSAAAAHVAAVAALLLEQHGMNLTPDQLYAYLTSTARNIADPAWLDSTSGYGMVDAYGALVGRPIPEPAAGLMLFAAALMGGPIGRRAGKTR